MLVEKNRFWRIALDKMTTGGECITIHAHTTGKAAVCPKDGQVAGKGQKVCDEGKMVYGNWKWDWNHHPN